MAECLYNSPVIPGRGRKPANPESSGEHDAMYLDSGSGAIAPSRNDQEESVNHVAYSAAARCLRACMAKASGPFSSTLVFIHARNESRSRAIASHSL